MSKYSHILKTQELKNFDYFGISDIGQLRDVNQDRISYTETINGELFIVCDGVGGGVSGEVAAELTIENITSKLSQKWYEDIYSAVGDAISEANNVVKKYSNKTNNQLGTASTIVLALIRDNEIYYAHVGDSRIYYSVNKKLFQTTIDHSYVQDLIQKKIISKKEARNHPKKNIITRAVGANNEIEPEICKKTLKPETGNLLLLCSDGLTTMLPDKEIETIINSSDNAEIICKTLIEKANNKGGEDNISVQIVRFFNIEQKTKQKKTKKNHIFKKKRKKKIFFVSVILLIILIPLFKIISTELKTIGQTSEFLTKKTYPSDFYKYSKKDTVVVIFIKKYENIIDRLQFLNISPEQTGYGTAIKSKNLFFKFYIPCKQLYFVKLGDNFCILEKLFDVTKYEILKANKKSNFSLTPGEIIIIPKKRKVHRQQK